MSVRIINILLLLFLAVSGFIAYTHPVRAQETDAAMVFTHPVRAQDVDAAIGDSIALGTGRAMGVAIYAWADAGSCTILQRVPALRFRNIVVSAGINDPPGECVELLLVSLLHAERVVVILPAWVNSARANVLLVATRLHLPVVTYQCAGPCTIRNFHPASYADLAADVQAIWDAP